MKNAFLIITIFISTGYNQFLHSQILATCKHNKFSFFAEKVEKIENFQSQGIIYYVRDSMLQKSDTLFIGFTCDVSACVCSDSLVAFHLREQPADQIKYFGYRNQKWVYLGFLPLPQNFPLIGYLIDGKIYKKYEHFLIAPNKIVSQLTLLKAQDQSLIKVEQYDIEFGVISNAVDNSKPKLIGGDPIQIGEDRSQIGADALKLLSKGPFQLIVEKKTLRKE